MSCNGDEECDIRPGTVTPKKLPKQSGGGGHEFVTDLPETGDEGVEYVLMDDFSDCSTYRGTFVWNEDCGGWIQTSGSGGGAVERYTFEQTATGWRAKRNNTVIFTYVDKDTIDSYENTADGFQITRNGVVIFTHTDGGGGDCKEYTITSTADGWVFKEDGVTKFTYTEPANDPSDGTYFTSGTLTTAITGTTIVAASSVTGLTLADVVIGETLIYDEAGSVGRVTAVNGTNLTVETITTAPGERRGTRLGAVDDYTDLPATCAAAVALGWQTPLAGDFAYVREDTSHDSHLTEWVISNIDSSCNITWAYSHTLNAGNYVLDIYKYGDYPSGSPIPKNPDGSVTLPKDEDTKYDFENLMDGSDIIGWRVKDHDTGTVLYTYTDLNDNDTYSFEDVTVSGNVVGWRVKDKNGTVIYTYTDLNDKSDGTYFTSATLDTDITDQTTVAASTVTGLTLADVVVGETLIYDGDGTVGVVTAVSGTDLTVDTITVAGSGDASSYVYKTTGTLDTTVDNTVNLALSTLSNSAGTTPTASDIIIGKTLAWDDDGTVALAVAISGTDVTFRTVTVAGAGGGSYIVNKPGETEFGVLQFKATAGQSRYIDAKAGDVVPFDEYYDGDLEYSLTNHSIKLKAGHTYKLEASLKCGYTDQAPTPSHKNMIRFYNLSTGTWLPIASNASSMDEGQILNQIYTPTQDCEIQLRLAWSDPLNQNQQIRVTCYNGSAPGLTDTDHEAYFQAYRIASVVDPIKYLDNSEGLQDTPVGNIISYMGNNVPRHYLACDGTIYNIGDYPALEAHFVEEFGSVNYFGGNGTTTWAVPDLQGEFLRGTGTNSHANQGNGANVGVHQDATIHNMVTIGDSNTHIYALDHINTNDDSSVARASGQARLYSGGTSSASGSNYTSRPTNTSVKYCIKYESTMQVILGADQYAVRGTYARNTATATWQLNTLTATAGDTSLVKNGVFYAPEDGYYQLTANTGWTNGTGLWMTWQRQATALVGNTQANTNANMLLNNTGNPGGSGAGISGVSREALSGAVWLNKGDPVTLQTYCGTVQDANAKLEWSIVRLTGSVDINEINLIAADDVYSTDEQLVGSYLGKPLYKKTVTTTINSTTSNIVPYSALSANVDKTCIVKYKGRMTNADTGNTVTGIPCYYADAAFVDCFFQNNGIHIVAGTQYGVSGRICEITYYYTKTSDTAGSAPNKNSLLLTRPDLWTPGTEYDFGGGLYGQRFTGTITTTGSGTMFSGVKTIDSSLTNAHIVDSGGVWDRTPKGSNYSQYPLGHSYTALATSGSTTVVSVVMTSWLDVVQSGTRAGLNFCVVDNGASTTNYDVWCTYTK